MDIKIFDLAESQTYMDIGPRNKALNISGFSNLVTETDDVGGFFQASFEVAASITRPYPVHSYLPAKITEGPRTVFEGYVAPKYPKRRWDGESQMLSFVLYGLAGHFAELPTVGLYIDAGVKHSTFVTDWIHGGVVASDADKGDPYLRCSAGDIATTDAARTSPVAFAPGATWREILDELVKDEGWEWGIYEGKLLYFRPKPATIDYYIYMSDSYGELEDPYGEICDLVIAPYRPAFGSSQSHTWYPEAGWDPPTNRLGVRRYFPGTGNMGIAQVTLRAQTSYDFLATPRVTGALTVRKVYDKDGIEIPRWSVRAGRNCGLLGYQPWEVIDTFRIAHTNYSHNAGTVTLEREQSAVTMENLLVRIGG